MEIQSVMNKYGELEPFQPKRITYKIMEETGLDKEEASKIQNNVIHALKTKYTENEISTSTIRSLINQQLISKGFIEEEKKSRKLGMSVSDFEDLLENGNKDNANIFYSPEMIAKYSYDAIAKEYALLTMPKECAEAHKNGFIHCLGGNNNLIVKENGIITIKNIVEIVDSFTEIDYYVPSINPNTLEIEWKKIIDGACTGKKPIYELEFGKGYKIECTSDHKFLKYDSQKNKFLKNYNICIDDFENYKSKNSIRFGSLNYIPHQNNNETYLKSAFYGFFLGDGSLIQNSKVQFHLVKSDKIDYITNLLDLMDVEYISKEYNKDKTTYVICDNVFEFKDKNSLPSFELNYTGLLEGLINSDGYVTTHGGLNCNYLEFDSTNKFIADLFFISCLIHNIRPSYQKININSNHSDVYRCVVQNNFVRDLLWNITLREKHKNNLTENKSKHIVHKTSGISPKNIEYLRTDFVYNITVEDNHNFMAGTQGFVLTQNCHDLEYWNTRPNCANWSIPFIAKNGIKIDGNGEYGSATKPAKSLEVLLNHMLEFLMAGALFLSGGQSFSSFNVYLAPYCKNKSYIEIKQAIQNFMFNCNCALIARGGQTIFSSINIEFGIPEFLKDEPAISFGGHVDGVYGDYEKEAKLLFKAIVEVTKEKDANGRYHTFPNQIYMVRDGTFDEYDEEVQMVHELLAENPTIYFSNVSEEYTENAVTMGALSSDTPVMTNQGFKYPTQLKIGDEVMTYSEDGSKEWNRIYNIIPKPAPSNVFKITLDNNYQFKVTDNHKLPTDKGIVKSEDLKVGMELYDYIDEPYIPTNDIESEFLGIFLADGYIRDKNRVQGSNGNVIEFHVKQLWKKDRICEICSKNDYRYELIPRDDASFTIYVKEKKLRDKFNSCYGNDGVKHFPSWIWSDKNIIANVIKGLMFDGMIESKKAWCWSSSDLPLVIDVLYALSYIGRKSKIYVDDRSGKSGNWRTNYRISFGLNYEPKNKTKIKSIELVNNSETVYDLSIENNPNYVCGLGGIHSENCRTRMPQTFTGDYAKDCLNVGNFHYVTLNLPLIALESKDYNDFQIKLTHYMNISRLALLDRKKNVEDILYNKHMSDFLIQKDADTGEQLYDIERCSFSIGLCGLNECLLTLFDMDIIEGIDYGEDIIKLMTDNLDIYKENDGLRWSLFFSPAESTAHRFAEINMQKYPDEAIVQGQKDYYYLTNSSHIDVSNDANLIEHIKNADVFHKYAVAGNICHLWLGEAYPNPKSLYSLNKKIAKTNIKFWAFTNDYTYCRNCHHTTQMNLLNGVCPICGSDDLLVMTRITGYFQPVVSKNGGGFNNGKLQEFKDRYRHKINS